MIMMIQKIRRAKLQIEDAIFWVLVSFMFVLFSLFPPVADFLAHLLGIYATVNFLFLMMIFLLLLRVFSMTIRMSQQETKVKELAQKLALYELEQREKAKEDLCKTDDVGRGKNLCKADDAGRREKDE